MNKMKFSLLPIGTTFVYKGEDYTKTGPILASRSSDGSQRMVPRSAVVSGEGEQPEAVPTTPPKSVELQSVKDAFETFYNACLEHLSDAGLDENHPALEELDRERTQFLQTLDQ